MSPDKNYFLIIIVVLRAQKIGIRDLNCVPGLVFGKLALICLRMIFILLLCFFLQYEWVLV